MENLTIGLGMFTAVSALLYVLALLAPEARSDAELDEVRSTRGDRVAEGFRQMDQQRTYTVRIGRVVLPLAASAFVIALVVDLVR